MISLSTLYDHKFFNFSEFDVRVLVHNRGNVLLHVHWKVGDRHFEQLLWLTQEAFVEWVNSEDKEI